MRTSIYIVFSTAIVAGAMLHGDYFQDYSQSNASTFTDQNHGSSSQPRNSANWQNPNNNWNESEYTRANPNENNWTAEANQDQSLNQYQEQAPNLNRDQIQNQRVPNTDHQNLQPNVSKRTPNNNQNKAYSRDGDVGLNDTQTPQRSYDSRPAPTNWENSQSSSNSVWNNYYDNQNPPQTPPQPNQRQRVQPQRTPTPQPNTNQGAQWVSYDDSTQSQKYIDRANATDDKSPTNDNFNNDATSPGASFKSDAGSKDSNAKNSDLKITRSIQLALTRDKSLSTLAQHVIVMTNNGQVYLRGNVNNDAEKGKVEAIARKMDGVSAVDNQVNVLNISSP